ncbi:MAG TPA: KUP/HAK/KT family potassium transporter, partial [Polyangiaceae bacterium]
FDLPFFGANLLKFFDGGYIPIVVGALFFVIMVNWNLGRQYLRELLESKTLPLAEFLSKLPSSGVTRVAGTAIYMSSAQGVPVVLRLQAQRVKSIMEQVVILTVLIEHEPQLDDERRAEVKLLEHGFVNVVIRFGYMENPLVPPVLAEALEKAGRPLGSDTTYYVGRETFVGGEGGKMKPLAEGLFSLLSRNAKSPVDHFGLPIDKVVELGMRIDL